MSPYDFGGPVDYLTAIHFPKGKKGALPTDIVAPWFWYITRQRLQFFVYLGGVWGPGWEFLPIAPVIKILPIDTQPEIPTPVVGFSSIEEAVDRTNAGEPISSDAWGRFYFGGPKADAFWWKVNTGKVGNAVPKYSIKKGCPTQPKDPKTGLPVGPPLATTFQNIVRGWRDHWNNGAVAQNAAASGVDPVGNYNCVLPYNGGYYLPGPNPDETLPELSRRLGVDQYFGAIPVTEIFSSGHAFIIKQGFAFSIEVAQLDPFTWDFTHFPPKRTNIPQVDGGSGRPPFSVTHNASANNPLITAGLLPPFPQNAPNVL